MSPRPLRRQGAASRHAIVSRATPGIVEKQRCEGVLLLLVRGGRLPEVV